MSLLAMCGCTRSVVTVHDPIPAPAPSSVRATLQRQVQNAVDAGDGDAQMRELRARAAAEPDNVEARLALAAHYGARGLGDVELEHYRLIVERFPESAAAAMALAKNRRAAGANLEARDILAAFCKRNPGAPARVFALVGILEDGLGNLTSAEAWHRAAIVRQPDLDTLHNNLGYNLLSQQRAGEAAAEFRRALELNPKSEIARNNLGVALASDPKEAVLQWQSISDPATAHSNMAAVFIEQKRYAEARQQIKIALGFSPGHPAALKNLKLLDELDSEGAEVSAVRQTVGQRLAAALRKAFGAAPAPQNPAPDEKPVTAAK
jgi:tetratricopeptide (TPR) repeat protein